MALPIAIAGLAATVASAGVQAYGQYQQGQALKSQANYQAQIANINANLAKQDANYQLAVGGLQAEEVGMETKARVGAERVGFAAGNVDPTKGTPSRVVDSTIELGRQKEQIIMAGAQKEAYGSQVRAAQATAQGQLYTMAAQTAPIAAGLEATGSIIGGVGNVSSKWLQAQQYGIFPMSS